MFSKDVSKPQGCYLLQGEPISTHHFFSKKIPPKNKKQKKPQPFILNKSWIQVTYSKITYV